MKNGLFSRQVAMPVKNIFKENLHVKNVKLKTPKIVHNRRNSQFYEFIKLLILRFVLLFKYILMYTLYIWLAFIVYKFKGTPAHKPLLLHPLGEEEDTHIIHFTVLY